MSNAAEIPVRRRGLVRRLPWRAFRRLSQFFFLALFFYLFRKTESSGADALGHPSDLFFHFDPLAGAAAMLGARAFIHMFVPAIVVIVLTALLGRFFCGWFCPLGTLLDLVHRALRSLTRRTNRWLGGWTWRLRPVRFVLLVLVLAFAAFRLPLVGYLDPFALLTRGLTLAIDPAFNRHATALANAADNAKGHWSAVADRVYPFARDHILPFSQQTFLLAGVALAILAIIFALELIQRRFWCRYLCPLGAMVGVGAQFTALRRVPMKTCSNCPAAETCSVTCRMDALPAGGQFKADDCTLCMDCVAGCPEARSAFKFKLKSRSTAPRSVDLSRRAALIAFATGVAVPAVMKASRVGRSSAINPELLRPPGVADEQGFLNLCVRCGLCLKVCPTNGLQPSALLGGLEGIFSPRLVPRMGYCEIGCTLCSQACPTGAIPQLAPKLKATTVIGKAAFDLDRCLPWAKNEECICCEEHCPVPEKAIGFDEVHVKNAKGETITLQRPFVHWERCTGCGICENKCPLDGEAAIHVRRTEYVMREGGRGRGSGGGEGHERSGGGRGRGQGGGRRGRATDGGAE